MSFFLDYVMCHLSDKKKRGANLFVKQFSFFLTFATYLSTRYTHHRT